MVLMHAPAFFDFRQRRDIYFPFLGTSASVPITPLYEYFPVGFKTLQQFLLDRGHDVKIINLCTVLLRFPQLNFDDLVASLDTRLVGIDLHWMVHVQGSLEVARRIHELRSDISIIFGGISSTYYAQELISYPFIDMVMRGYDTHEPVAQLLDAMKADRSLEGIPNLLWKDFGGSIRSNGFSHKPDRFSIGIDWARHPGESISSNLLPILEILTTHNAGCSYHCRWCGGSRNAFRRIHQSHRSIVHKPATEMEKELQTINRIQNVERFHFYSNGTYNEKHRGMHYFLEQIGKLKLKSISYEQYYLTPDDILEQMARSNQRTSITLSPDSHDLSVAKLAGRGVYTNEEMEAWIERALGIGIQQIDIWYVVGMPQQGPDSVYATVDSCHRLIEIFKGQRVNPMICPMIPFLDPGSTFFCHPAKNGYRIFHRSAEEHRRGMESASIINRINYETRWLSRQQLVEVGFQAVRQLMEMKADVGVLPRSLVQNFNAKIDDALKFIPEVHEVDCISDPKERTRQLDLIGDEILRRNNLILFEGVMNQAFPLNRQIGGRWFDETGWDPSLLERYCEPSTTP
jgi:clorobiocin biosynthesis protein CloN6